MNQCATNPDIEFSKHPNCYFAKHAQTTEDATLQQHFADRSTEDVIELVQSSKDEPDENSVTDSY